MAKYRKKPVVIEAIKWEGTIESFKKITNLYAQNKNWEDCIRNVDLNSPFDFHKKNITLAIHTLEGIMEAREGDYIIKGVNGEFYPCKPYIFHKTYEQVK